MSGKRPWPLLALVPVAVLVVASAAIFALREPSPPPPPPAPEPIPAQPEQMIATLDACLAPEAFEPVAAQERQRFQADMQFDSCGSQCHFDGATAAGRHCVTKATELCGDPTDRGCLEAFVDHALNLTRELRADAVMPVPAEDRGLSRGFLDVQDVFGNVDTASSMVTTPMGAPIPCFHPPAEGEAALPWCPAQKGARLLINTHAARYVMDTFRDDSLAPLPSE